MNRNDMLDRARGESAPWDILIVGGGATGLGAAVDAANRGYRTLLVEQHDFAKATSSRSTKLIHGGVRYLEQGNISLVLEALRERGRLIRNAPHLVRDLGFVVPAYRWWESSYYGFGLRAYSLLAGRYGIAPAENLNRDETLERLANVNPKGLRGGIQYFDAQFDDARLAITMAMTAADEGATLLNYARVTDLHHEDGRVRGATVVDGESGDAFDVRANVVVNATGVFTDAVRRLDAPDVETMVVASQGAHIVVDREFFRGELAMLIPKTEDGRVLFAIPWHNHVVLGTTDIEVPEASLEPKPMAEELEFLMHHAELYLDRAPKSSDVRSVFAGLRPLVRPAAGGKTSKISRDHVIDVSGSGLVTIAGGKWTTYRQMAEDVIDKAAEVGDLAAAPCGTGELALHGAVKMQDRVDFDVYGTDAPAVAALSEENPDWADPLHDRLPITGRQVVWAARHEMARSVEDVLARRTRALFLDAEAATRMAPRVAQILRRELQRDEPWAADQVESFTKLALDYQMP